MEAVGGRCRAIVEREVLCPFVFVEARATETEHRRAAVVLHQNRYAAAHGEVMPCSQVSRSLVAERRVRSRGQTSAATTSSGARPGLFEGSLASWMKFSCRRAGMALM